VGLPDEACSAHVGISLERNSTLALGSVFRSVFLGMLSARRG
jgi:hypothetical protein